LCPSRCEVERGADGTQGPAGYVVPLGQVLVVTDIACRVHSGPAGADFQGVLALDQVGGKLVLQGFLAKDRRAAREDGRSSRAASVPLRVRDAWSLAPRDV
jgi:hypothetical protein